MNHSVVYDPEEKIIIAKITGKTELAGLREVGENIIQLAKQKNCFRILTDLSDADLHVTTLEVFNLPQDLTEIAKFQRVEIHTLKRAFVALKDQVILDFYETVSRNRSHHTKLFFDFEEAKNWLRG